MWLKTTAAIVILALCQITSAQENAQTRIPQSLIACYADPELRERDNRLPSNINMLIELIRKVEDTPSVNLDMRQMALALIHRFRLDGIERAPGAINPNVTPFSPSGFQFWKHRVILSRLLPGNAVNFPNGTLTQSEQCALHFMLSHSVETQVRGDEAQRCGQLAPIRALRIPRALREPRGVKSNLKGDVELMEELKEYHHRKSGNMQLNEDYPEAIADEEVTEGDTPERAGENEFGDEEPVEEQSEVDTTFIGNQANVISQCPVENGAIRTSWGAVSGGTVISGIAAGIDQQNVPIQALLANSRNFGQLRARQTNMPTVDNRWATTLSGDLSEVALLQGPGLTPVAVGAIGGWNSTFVPRWYFLTQRERFQMTDAEIRGGLDGLILAMNVVNYRSQATGMRLSQLLDMYYSQRGVFTSPVRACNRRALFTEVAPVAQMEAQTTAFSLVLDREMQLVATLSDQSIQSFSNAAVQSLSTYVPTSLSDPSCESTSITPTDQTIWRSATRIFIYVDTTWTFQQINPVVSFLLENLDVNRFGTTYTLMNAADGATIVSSTNVLSDFYMLWNNTVHQQHPQGVNLPNILASVRNQTTVIMNEERTNSSVGGQSMITLLIANTAGVNEADSNFAFEQILLMREQVPDLVLLYLAGGTASRFNRFARTPSTDVFQLTVGSGATPITASVNPLIQRIQQVPRRIINHRCGANWWQEEWGASSMNAYVERGGIVFYRLHPNYFFGRSDNRRIRIQGHGYSTISVCHSRWTELPRFNGTNQNPDVTCQQVDSQTVEISLNNACDGTWLIRNCQPLFISIEGLASNAVPAFRCSDDNECRFPDNVRFGINHDNLGCFSGAGRLVGAIAWLVLSVFLVRNL